MGANYEVTQVGPTIVDGLDGRPTRGIVVTFVTRPSGLVGEVRVPDAAATPADVGPLLDTAAATLEAIKHL